jgi:four helix bundle protein
MILQLSHTKLDIFKISKQMVLGMYKLSAKFPQDERFAMTSQIRRAATSVHLNIAEGCSRKSAKERNRFFEISRGSLVEVDAVIGLAFDLDFITMDDVNSVAAEVTRCFQMLCKIIDVEEKKLRENVS